MKLIDKKKEKSAPKLDFFLKPKGIEGGARETVIIQKKKEKVR